MTRDRENPPHLLATATEIADQIVEIEALLIDHATRTPVEFAAALPPRNTLIERASVVLERRGGAWGLYVHEIPAMSVLLLLAAGAMTGQPMPKGAGLPNITPLREAPLVVRAAFLNQAEQFVNDVLVAMEEARMAAAPSLAAGSRALARLRSARPTPALPASTAPTVRDGAQRRKKLWT